MASALKLQYRASLVLLSEDSLKKIHIIS